MHAEPVEGSFKTVRETYLDVSPRAGPSASFDEEKKEKDPETSFSNDWATRRGDAMASSAESPAMSTFVAFDQSLAGDSKDEDMFMGVTSIPLAMRAEARSPDPFDEPVAHTTVPQPVFTAVTYTASTRPREPTPEPEPAPSTPLSSLPPDDTELLDSGSDIGEQAFMEAAAAAMEMDTAQASRRLGDDEDDGDSGSKSDEFAAALDMLPSYEDTAFEVSAFSLRQDKEEQERQAVAAEAQRAAREAEARAEAERQAAAERQAKAAAAEETRLAAERALALNNNLQAAAPGTFVLGKALRKRGEVAPAAAHAPAADADAAVATAAAAAAAPSSGRAHGPEEVIYAEPVFAFNKSASVRGQRPEETLYAEIRLV